jgi:penicillin-binding protein 1A
MDFSKKGIIKRQHQIKSWAKRLVSKSRVFSFRLALLTFIALGIFVCITIFAAAKAMIDDAPELSQINIDPEKFTTHIYYSDGSVSGTVVGAESNRILVTSDQIPKMVKDCFVAIEDKRFYEHDGIDLPGIARAGYSGIKSFLNKSGGLLDYGASTITQQLLKIRVFDYGNEPKAIDKITRKVQEQYLAIQLEDAYTKDEILVAYMNNINLGNRSFGVQMAALNYFGKNVWDLTLSEAAVIAAIALSPVRQNPINFPEENAKRRQSCLDTMLELEFCTPEQYDEAVNDEVYARIKNYAYENNEETYYSYFNDAVIRQVLNDLIDIGYSAEKAEDLLYSGGLDIFTTQDKEIQAVVDSVYCNEENFPAMGNEGGSFYELTQDYSVSILRADETPDHFQLSHVLAYYKDYNDSDLKFYHEYYRNNHRGISRYTTDPDLLNEMLDKFIAAMMEEGDSILAERPRIYTLQPQSSFTVIDQKTGYVMALYGGRGEKIGSLTLNRATSTLRQVGSTFKVLASFLPALDTAGMTLASVADDAEYHYPGTNTKVDNWNGEVYEGLTPIRRAIYRSMNIVACRVMEQVTPQVAFDYLKKLGFTTLVESQTGENGKVYSDIGIPLALGGITNGVTNLELTAAYATIANNGIYNRPVLYTKVLDHNGKVLLSNDSASTQVIKTSTSYLLTNAMCDTTTIGTGTNMAFKQGEINDYITAYAKRKFGIISDEDASSNEDYKTYVSDLKSKVSGMPIAGKTGSSHYTDLWFVGYSPYYTAAVWTGFDNNVKQINRNYHQHMWRKIMEQIHVVKEKEAVSFPVPDSIISATICTKCGNLAVTGLCDQVNCVKTEIFAKGTVPNVKCTCHVKASVCSVSGQLASVYCPPETTSEKVFLIKEETSPTYDTPNLLPTGEDAVTCTIHTAESILPPEPDEPQDPSNPDDDGDLDIPLPPPPGEPDIPTPSKKPTPTPTPTPSEEEGDEPEEDEPGEDDYEDEWID